MQVRPPPWIALPESMVLDILPAGSMVPVFPNLAEAVSLASPSSPSGGCSVIPVLVAPPVVLSKVV